MLYFNSEEERAAHVERMYEEWHRTPKPVRTAPFVLLTRSPPPPKPKFTLVAKPK